MTSIITVGEHQAFTNMLDDWRILGDLIADTLEHVEFVRRGRASTADDIRHRIALMFDEQRDIELATCLIAASRLDDLARPRRVS